MIDIYFCALTCVNKPLKSGLRACWHVPSPSPSLSPSNLHCVYGDGPFHGQNGLCINSVCQMVHFHPHNDKLWWRRWRRRRRRRNMYTGPKEFSYLSTKLLTPIPTRWRWVSMAVYRYRLKIYFEITLPFPVSVLHYIHTNRNRDRDW